MKKAKVIDLTNDAKLQTNKRHKKTSFRNEGEKKTEQTLNARV
jgi:hypothetical protein